MFATAFFKEESLGQSPRLRISVDLNLRRSYRSYLPPTSPCRNVGGDAFFVAHQKQKCRRIKALGTKISITKKPMPENLLQKPKMCVIIHFGRRLSGCIGVAWHFYAGLSYASTIARLFVLWDYYTPFYKVCQYIYKIWSASPQPQGSSSC